MEIICFKFKKKYATSHNSGPKKSKEKVHKTSEYVRTINAIA